MTSLNFRKEKALKSLKEKLIKECIPQDNKDVVKVVLKAGIVSAVNRLAELDLLKI